jgi:hypothetical protein
MTNPAPGTGKFLGANFWNIDWEGQQDYFQASVNFSTAIDPWRPELIQDLSPYRVLRFMEWNDINLSQTAQAHFNTRKAKTAIQNQPVAYEWQIDLCNRTDKDCWLNVHHLSTPDDWRQIAQLFKDKLKPTLRLYIEWSNEVWNNAFPQSNYAAGEAGKLALPGSNGPASYSVYASVRMFEEFGRVFASEPQRLVRVLSGQSVWSGPCESQLEALSNKQINPSGTWPDAYAIAPYLYGGSVQELRNAIPNTAAGATEHRSCTQRMGVPLIAYEAGSDSYSLGAGCVSLQKDPGMRPIYRDFLAALFTAGMNGPLMMYAHSGACWGMKLQTSDPLSASPKYQGILDWLAP